MNSALASFELPIASMLALALLAWIVRRVSRLPVCPVCVGVSATWLWMLVARLGGFAVDIALLAILLGASVVGGAQWVENRLPPGRSPLLWKVLALPAGCVAAYGLVAERWGLAAIGAAVVALVAALFLRPRRAAAGNAAVVAQIEERMKKCC